jgi:NAD(P)-dependent dehydrogenase (short-subunit alcohol dehydrogenase family)
VLARVLLPALERGAQARVVIVSAPATTRPDLDDLQGQLRFRRLHAFGASMVEKLLFAFALARRVDPARIVVNAVHPGLMKIELTREMPRPVRFLANLFSRPPERAAMHVADLVSGDLDAGNGSFVALNKVKKPPAVARDDALQEALWRATASLGRAPSLMSPTDKPTTGL